MRLLYCYARYLVGLLVITWEPHETGQSRGLAKPGRRCRLR